MKRLFTLEKSCASCLQMAKAVKLSPVGKCTTYVKMVWKPKILRFDKILISLLLYRIPNFTSFWNNKTNTVDYACKTDFPFPFQMTPVDGEVHEITEESLMFSNCWLFRLWAQGFVKNWKLKFRRDFEAEVWSVFCSRYLVEVTKLNVGQDSEARLLLRCY